MDSDQTFSKPFNKPEDEVTEVMIERKHENFLENGDRLYKEGQYRQALKSYKRALEYQKKAQEETFHEPEKVQLYHKLGLASFKTGRYTKASNLLKQALQLQETLEASNKSLASSIRLSLGRVYFTLAQFSEARDAFNESLQTYLNGPMGDVSEIANCYNSLAELSKENKKHYETLEYLQKAIDIVGADESIESIFELSRSYSLMGRIYEYLSDIPKAMFYAEKAMKMREELYGPNHPETASCLNIVGHTLLGQTKYEEALKAYKRALEIRFQFLEDFHPDIANSYSYIGIVQCIIGKYKKSLENHEKALEIRKKCFGTNHPDIGNSYSNIANVLVRQRNLDEALKYYQQALSIDKQFYEEDHPNIDIDYESIGLTYQMQEKYLESETNLLIALNMSLRHGESKSSRVANLYNSLGALYHEQSDYKKAFEHYLKSLKIELSLFSNQYFKEANTYFNLNLLFRDNRDVLTAGCLSKKAQKIYKKNLGKKHLDTRMAEIEIKEVEQQKCLTDLYYNFNV